MSSNYYNQTIALAGIQQCLCTIQNIAWQGDYSESDMKVCLTSLFNFNPPNYEQVYGGRENLHTGFKALCETLEMKHHQRSLERTRYFAGLLVLSRNLSPQSELSRQFYTTLSMLEGAAEDYENQFDYLIERLAQLYRNTLSQMTPRLIINGEPVHLRSESNAAKIRALLLCAIRGCVLWRQAGGSQWRLVWGRSKILFYARESLK